MGNISESYSVLSKDCLQSGHRIFEVGRYLDKTRSDLVRGCSEITQQDWMRVFEVDHYVLTWRVYNNIVGFEHLQKKQVDNPAGCKLGKWLNRQTDERLVRSSEYTALVKAHCHGRQRKTAIQKKHWRILTTLTEHLWSMTKL